MDHRSSSSSVRTSASGLSNPIRALTKHLLRLRRRPDKDDAPSLCTRSDLAAAVPNNHSISPESAHSLLAQAFAGVSAVKAAYAQLQVAQSPYDPDAIQRCDGAVVAELKHLSYLKHAYLGGGRHFSHESRVFAEIQERRNVLRTFETTVRSMESVLRDKDRDLRELREKLLEAEEENAALESRLRPETSLAALGGLHISGLDPTHFLRAVRYAATAVRHFVEQVSGGSQQASVIIESHVCGHMFSGFDRHYFGSGGEASRTRFFEEFAALAGRSLRELLDGEGEGERRFQAFCRGRFEALAAPEAAFLRFAEMARRVWVLHMLFFSFEAEAEAAIFVAPRGCRYSEVYMERVGRGGGGRTVAFTVAPGFRVRRMVIQCRVWLEGVAG